MRSNSCKLALALLMPLMLFIARPALAQKYVCMQSSQGEWCMELLRSAAPNTVTNFLRYVNGGDYESDLVHRSVPGFVIQGGGFTWTASNSLTYTTSYGTINNEYRLPNERGTVAMAKMGGNVNSASSQWFINLADNSTTLDTSNNGGYTVFAKVVYGMEAVDSIASLRVVNITSAGDAALDTVPTTAPATVSSVGYSDMVIIKHAYTSDVLPYHCTPNVTVEALAELCNGTVTFPVQLLPAGQVYQATLEIVATSPKVVLRVKTGGLSVRATKPAVLASFGSASGQLSIPSVRVGSSVLTDVQLTLTNSATLEFVLSSYK